ncbi:MAG: arginine--tRNA ligase, partial [Zoogloeaceae bacterium]|nr:arginine--tRNA ligase [Zoogloeaceae bacterium]
HLDFDLSLAVKQSNDNPVYYIQYAHARICSVLKEWGGDPETLKEADLSALNAQEIALAGKLSQWPETIEAAAKERAPHQIAFYLKDLAAAFHAWYNASRFLVDEAATAQARLALALAVRQAIANGMKLLGVSCPEHM